jgi:uncharacterized coiled-coil protein SlyX
MTITEFRHQLGGDKVRHALTKERGLVARGEYHYTASDETDRALDKLIVEHRMALDKLIVEHRLALKELKELKDQIRKMTEDKCTQPK